MPFDGDLREMTRVEKLVHLREILRTQTDEDQTHWETCLHHGFVADALFQRELGFKTAFVWHAASSFETFFDIDYLQANLLVSARSVRKKRIMLNRLIWQERATLAKSMVKHLRETVFAVARRVQTA